MYVIREIKLLKEHAEAAFERALCCAALLAVEEIAQREFDRLSIDAAMHLNEIAGHCAAIADVFGMARWEERHKWR